MRSALPARLRAATTCVTATEATRMLGLRPRLVDGEASPAELIGVQLGDGFLRLLVRAHFHEREPAGAPRGHIAHHCNRFYGSRAREQLLELRFSRFVREVSDIQLPTHQLTPLSQTRQSAPCYGELVPMIPNGSAGGFRLELGRTSGGASQGRLVTPTGGTARGKIRNSILSLLF